MHPSWKECLECQGERSQLMDYGEPPRMPTLMEPSTASSPRGATVIEVPPGHPSHPAHVPGSPQTTGPLSSTRVVKPREQPAPATAPPPATPRVKTVFGGSDSESAPAAASPVVEKKVDRRIVGLLLTYTWKPEGQIFPVREGRNRIGRNAECEIALPEDPHLSGVNSHITYRKNFTIGDLVSMSGTDMNGVPIEETYVKLPNYAQIRAGSTHFTFIAVDPATGTAVT